MSAADTALLGLGDIRDLLTELGVRPRKRWGQNFVTDPNTVRRIVKAARLSADDSVLEVGPGLGSLTLGLLPTVRRVVAVEVDPVLAGRLARTVGQHAPDVAYRLDVIEGDALRMQSFPSQPTALVANLPYNVAVPVVLHLLEHVATLVSVLVMVQKEVADRLVAPPGSRVYGVPSVKARWYCDLEAAGDISTSVFWPTPHVDSGLVRMRRVAPPPNRAGRVATFAVVDAAFAQRRKTLRAALSAHAGGADRAEAALVAAGIRPSDRGENLSVADFARIADQFADGAAPDGSA